MGHDGAQLRPALIRQKKQNTNLQPSHTVALVDALTLDKVSPQQHQCNIPHNSRETTGALGSSSTLNCREC